MAVRSSQDVIAVQKPRIRAQARWPFRARPVSRRLARQNSCYVELCHRGVYWLAAPPGAWLPSRSRTAAGRRDAASAAVAGEV
jgi:hypothetical protein